jgi:uncharacterized protein with HEPN domain
MISKERRDATVVKKILKEINAIYRFVSGLSEDEFHSNDMVQRAVAMTLIHIGELTRAFSNEFRETHKNIPWKEIIGMRNIAAHNYEAVSMKTVWDTIKVHLPILQAELENV